MHLCIHYVVYKIQHLSQNILKFFFSVLGKYLIIRGTNSVETFKRAKHATHVSDLEKKAALGKEYINQKCTLWSLILLAQFLNKLPAESIILHSHLLLASRLT